MPRNSRRLIEKSASASGASKHTAGALCPLLSYRIGLRHGGHVLPCETNGAVLTARRPCREGAVIKFGMLSLLLLRQIDVSHAAGAGYRHPIAAIFADISLYIQAGVGVGSTHDIIYMYAGRSRPGAFAARVARSA
ncbi:hypothetical protein EVAR_30522_1 [Eumeta japonica]|uniref:Uncharacterized protein n=1 Tax=Eumeta variegata TaxID=151549 RepID=A0A4C1VXE6_EUMVA|nr:hypothetical protein EVAR_30522_1 [Eumeta japonica]